MTKLDNALKMARDAYYRPGPLKDLHLLAVCIDAMEEARDYGALYRELILAVEKKCPGETRHETALRYILSAERHDSSQAGKTDK